MKTTNRILAYERPDLLEEWDYEKNNSICSPDEVTVGSEKKVWWKCNKCHHEWETTIYIRTHGHGCPKCRKHSTGINIAKGKSHKGINDLATVAPQLLNEWDYHKNLEISPDEIAYSSNKKVWWKCQTCGHEWLAMINNRYKGSKCPNCMRHYHTSYPEQAVFYYVEKVFPDAINGYKPNWLPKKSEIDIYVPSVKLAIEYDGEAYHSNKKRELDKNKTELLQEKNINVVRIREPKSAILGDNSYIIETKTPTSNLNYLEQAIESLMQYIQDKYSIKTQIKIDIGNDYDYIVQSVRGIVKEKSLVNNHPELAVEWNYEKNNNLRPENFLSGSSVKVWWKCRICGHEWKAAIDTRAVGHGCPVCAGKVARKGVNDLKTLYPQIAAEWSTLNKTLKPDDILPNSAKKVWWKCQTCGHEWKAACNNRIANKSGCPLCSRKKQSISFTKNRVKKVGSLSDKYPSLLMEWNYEKNQISPEEVTFGSNKKVWWKCNKCGYEWETTINSRVHGRGCPKCNGRIKKTVFCVETNVKYESVHSASLETGVNKNSIRGCCNGRQKTAGGLHWIYADDKKR